MNKCLFEFFFSKGSHVKKNLIEKEKKEKKPHEIFLFFLSSNLYFFLNKMKIKKNIGTLFQKI